MAKNLNVYWAPAPVEGMNWRLIYERPRTLLSIMNSTGVKENDNSFLRCPAVTNMTSNTFVINAPINTGCKVVQKIDEDGDSVVGVENYGLDWSIIHLPSLRDQWTIVMKHGYIFFAEEEVEMWLTSPYFSRAPHHQYGTIIPGKFNCGAWFRPIHMEFNLWPGVEEVHLKEEEPIAYVNFLNDDRKVRLHRFNPNTELKQAMGVSSHSARWQPQTSLRDRYRLFRRTDMRNWVLSEIKKCLE